MQLSCVVLLCALVNAQHTSPPTSLGDILAAYELALVRFDSSEFTLDAVGRYRGPQAPNEIENGIETWSVRRDIDRWKIRYQGNGTNFFQNVAHDWKSENEFLLREDGSIYVQVDFDPNELAVSGTFDPNRSFGARTYLAYGTAILGYMPGDDNTRLDEVFRQGKVTLESGRVLDGTSTVLVESMGRLGSHRVWFDSVLMGLPRRIEVRKRAQDLYYGKPLATAPLQPPGSMWPETPLAEFTVVIDNVTIEDTPKGPAWKTFDQTLTYTHEGGKTATWRLLYRLSDLDFSPKFSDSDFEIETPIPEGTRVGVTEAPQIEYRWQDGWPKKFIDRGSLPAAEADEFKPGRHASRHSWIVFLSSVVLLALASWFAYRRFSAKY